MTSGSSFRLLALAASLFLAANSFAQAPAAVVAPAVAPAAAPVAAAMPAVKASAASVAKPTAKAAATAMPTTAAAGGGGGKVWVNEKSKTYHCEGTKFYGKTKVGEYMAEDDAKAKGNHGVAGKSCAAGAAK